MSIADAIMTRIANDDFEANPEFALEAERTKQFIQAVHTRWTSQAKYKDEQFDTHPYRPLIHVNSHQLTKAGKLKDKNRPNHRAYPCYLATHANHFADTLCGQMLEKIGRRIGDDELSKLFEASAPSPTNNRNSANKPTVNPP